LPVLPLLSPQARRRFHWRQWKVEPICRDVSGCCLTYGDFLGIRLLPPVGAPYLPLSRRIPWIEGTVKQSMRLTLERSPVVETASGRRPRPRPLLPRHRPRVPTPVGPAKEVSSAKGAVPHEELAGRIYADASFTTNVKDGAPEHIEGIVAIDPSTGKWTRIADGGLWPRVSPDGKRLAFIRDNTPKGAWACDAQTVPTPFKSSPRRYRRSGRPTERNSWLGSLPLCRVSTAARSTGRRRLQSGGSARDGSDPRPLPLPPLHDVEDWSPDGKWLATHRDFHAAAGAHLYVMRPDGTGQRQLTGPGYHYNWYPRFSPDGRWILHKHLEAAIAFA